MRKIPILLRKIRMLRSGDAKMRIILILIKKLKRTYRWSHVQGRQRSWTTIDLLEHENALQLGMVSFEIDHGVLSE